MRRKARQTDETYFAHRTIAVVLLVLKKLSGVFVFRLA